jgi:predicted O-methyltransferase YrrM
VRLLERILKASPERPTRLHDLRGKPIDWASLPNIPLAIADTSASVAFGYRREVPWISYRAQRFLGRLIQPNWRILEFGAGMSTVWFAKHSSFVFSVESDAAWYGRVKRMLELDGLTNVHLEHRQRECDAYSGIPDTQSDFDMALIDGDCRDRCLRASLSTVKAGGYVYLDNTDQPGDRQIAEQLLLAAPIQWHRYFNDFAPGLVAITQGLLAKLSS